MSNSTKKTELKIQIGGPIATLIITIIYSVLVSNVDRAPIGPNNTTVGMSKINGTVAARFGYNSLFDKITDVTMIVAILTALVFAFIGLMQLLKTKSLLKVDKRIIGLGCVYVFVMVLYVFFDKVPLNYRPVLVPGETELEASFPSTHVMVICTIMSTAVAFIKSVLAGRGDIDKDISAKGEGKIDYNTSVSVSGDKVKLRKALIKCAEIIMAVAVVGRILAGVHWITDIIGGLLISSTITEFYKALFAGDAEIDD